MRIKIILLCMVIGAFIACNIFFTCAGGIKEGFEMVGAAVDYAMDHQSQVRILNRKMSSRNWRKIMWILRIRFQKDKCRFC